MANKEGFFAKINGKPVGGYESLNQVREVARKAGKDIPIFYGVVVTDDVTGKIIKEDLYLVPKVKKED